MDGTCDEPGVALAADNGAPADRRAGLVQTVDKLEQCSAVLEAMELTLAVALLDHAIAEVRRNIAD